MAACQVHACMQLFACYLHLKSMALVSPLRAADMAQVSQGVKPNATVNVAPARRRAWHHSACSRATVAPPKQAHLTVSAATIVPCDRCSGQSMQLTARWQLHYCHTRERSIWRYTHKHRPLAAAPALPETTPAATSNCGNRQEHEQESLVITSDPNGSEPHENTSNLLTSDRGLLSQQQEAVGRDAWLHDVLLVDGTNVLHFAQASTRTLAAYLDSLPTPGPATGQQLAGNDGSNDGSRQQGKSSGSTTAVSNTFRAWVHSLQMMTQAREVYIIFDAPAPRKENPSSKQSTATGRVADTEENTALQDRKQLLPSYKAGRVQKKERKRVQQQQQQQQDTSLAATAEADKAATHSCKPNASQQQQQQQQQQRAWRYLRYAQACQQQLGCKIVWCPPGLEADDVLFTLASLLHEGDGKSSPVMRRSVAIASSDCDMQQMLALGPGVGWLELLHTPGQLAFKPTAHLSQQPTVQPTAQHIAKSTAQLTTQAVVKCSPEEAQQHTCPQQGAGQHDELPPPQQLETSQEQQKSQQQKRTMSQPQQPPSLPQQHEHEPQPQEHIKSQHLKLVQKHRAPDNWLIDTGHVAALQSYAWAGSMAWLPVCIHHAQQGDELPSGKLHAHQVADYQALVGKKEAGVKGAGLSAKQAVGLLRRYNDLTSTFNEYSAGRLNARLQPVKPPAKLSGQLDSMGLALQTAVRNLNVTRLRNATTLLPPKLIQEVTSKPLHGSPSSVSQQMQFTTSRGPVQQQHKLQVKSQKDSDYQQLQQQQSIVAASGNHAGSAPRERRGRLNADATSDSWVKEVALRHPVYSQRVHGNQPFLTAMQAGGGPAWLQRWLAGQATALDSADLQATASKLAGQRTTGAVCMCNYVTPEGLMLDMVVTSTSEQELLRQDASGAPPMKQQTAASGMALDDGLFAMEQVAAGKHQQQQEQQQQQQQQRLRQQPPPPQQQQLLHQQQREGLVLLGPADFNHEAVALLKTSLSRDQGITDSQPPTGKASGKFKQPTQAEHAYSPVAATCSWPASVLSAAHVLSSHCGPRVDANHLPSKLKVLLKPEIILMLRALKKAGWQVLFLPFWEIVLS